jgi:hypothetical protein
MSSEYIAKCNLKWYKNTMDKQELLEVEYHWREQERHLSERQRLINASPVSPEFTPEANSTERFDVAYARIKPLIKLLRLGYHDWYVTPEVPVTGTVEGEEISVKLSFNIQGDTIHPWINSHPTKPYNGKGVHDLWASRDWCVATDAGKSSDSGSYPKRLAHIEELIDVYFAQVEQMSPEQREEAGTTV